MKTNYRVEILAMSGSDGFIFIPQVPENIFNFIRNKEGELVIGTSQEISFCVVKDGSSNFPVIKGNLSIEGEIDEDRGLPNLKFKTEIRANPSRTDIIESFRNIISIEYDFITKTNINQSITD